MRSETLITWKLRLFGLLRIPLIFFCFPRVISITDNSLVVKIKLNYRTKNHLSSMYFGVLSIGADVTGAFLAMNLINKSKSNIALIFKDFHADFIKRAEGDVHFICNDGLEIKNLVEQAKETGARVNLPVNVLAVVPSISNEPVAKFVLTLSLKKR